MERQRYTAQPRQGKSASQARRVGSHRQRGSKRHLRARKRHPHLLAERAGHPGGVAAVRNPVLSRAKRGDMRGKYMISKQIAPRRRCEAVNATPNAANAAPKPPIVVCLFHAL